MAAAPAQVDAIRGKMSHEQALATAVNIVRCTTAASLTNDDIPDGLSAAQQRQFKERALAGADCSALDSPYSIYDLAYYAASGSDSGAKIIFSGLAAHQFDDERSMFDASLIEHFNQVTVAFLHEAAEMGNSNALMSLAAIYEDGIHTQKDLARAHAYAAVITRVTGGKGQRYEQLLSKQLSPQQRADSARWQKVIFRQRGTH